MRVNKRPELHTPDGLRDFLPDEYAFKFETERRLEKVFHSYGYLSVGSPTLEHAEVFEGGGTKAGAVHKLIDRSGEILTLRPDMTPAMARIAATHFTADELPLRFCYTGNNFRYSENNQGKQREFTQSGVELIGVDGSEADGETVAAAVNALLEAGLKDFRLDLGHALFLAGALEETGLSPDERAMLHHRLVDREYTAVESFINERKIPDGVRRVFREPELLTGGRDMLDRARAMITNGTARSALGELEGIFGILTDYGLDKYLRVDLGMTGHLDYYTGLIFRGYAYGTGFSVLDGGRYNKLLGYFGRELPSVGFGIKVDDLVDALVKQNVSFELERADTLLTYNAEGRRTALATGDALRRQGAYVENSVHGDDLDANLAYARRRNMGGVLCFMGANNVKVINLHKNETVEVSIDRLLGRSEPW